MFVCFVKYSIKNLDLFKTTCWIINIYMFIDLYLGDYWESMGTSHYTHYRSHRRQLWKGNASSSTLVGSSLAENVALKQTAVANTLAYYDTAIISAVKCFKVKPQVHLVILGATTLSLMALAVTVLGIKDSRYNSSNCNTQQNIVYCFTKCNHAHSRVTTSEKLPKWQLDKTSGWHDGRAPCFY